MAQQTFSGVPGDFSAGQVLTAADMDKLREFLLYLIKDGDETDTGEVSPLILDLNDDRVGVNTDAPAQALDVNGNVRITGSNRTITTASAQRLDIDAEALYLNENVSSNIAMVTGGGKVGIGQASPVYHLQVEGDNATQGFVAYFKQLNAGTVPSVIAAIAGNATPAANSYWLACYDNSGSVLHGAIAGNGAGVTFYSASDRRLKTNIGDLTGALAIVEGLQPRLFEWVDATDLGVQHGFIADEVAEVYPLVVTGDKDAMNPAIDPVLDDDGNELEPAQPETIAPQMIDATKLVPLLTAAIQELTARVAALEAAA
jgi:hypothetical protein